MQPAGGLDPGSKSSCQHGFYRKVAGKPKVGGGSKTRVKWAYPSTTIAPFALLNVGNST